MAPCFISALRLFPPRPSHEPGLGGDSPSGDTGPRPPQARVSVSRGPSAPSLTPRSLGRQPPPSSDALSSSFSFISPLQGWTLPGARWPLAEAEPEDGPPQCPSQEMESLLVALEEGEPKGLGARWLRAPAPGEQQLWPLRVAGSAQLEAKPRSPRGPAVRMAQVRMARVPCPTKLPYFSPAAWALQVSHSLFSCSGSLVSGNLLRFRQIIISSLSSSF